MPVTRTLRIIGAPGVPVEAAPPPVLPARNKTSKPDAAKADVATETEETP